MKIKKPPRDNNVTALYELENDELSVGRNFATIEEARNFVNFVTSSLTWRVNSARPKCIQVYSNGDHNYSEAKEPNEIWLANSQLTAQVVLHELAHFVSPMIKGHGPKFVRNYLTLIAHFMGVAYADIYRDAFTRSRIKF